MQTDERVTDAMVKRAAAAFSKSCVVYPDGTAYTPISDWFDLDAHDAADFGVLQVPKWDGHSDIRAMQHEAYIAAVVELPMRAALTAALSDEPTQAGEPVAWRYRYKDGKWSVQKNKPHWFRDGRDFELEPLYTDPVRSAIVPAQDEAEKAKPNRWHDEAAAEQEFTDYFCRNYPGPDTIIYDPKWHAPKIFRAAKHALLATVLSPRTVSSSEEQGEGSAIISKGCAE